MSGVLSLSGGRQRLCEWWVSSPALCGWREEEEVEEEGVWVGCGWASWAA